MSNAPNLIARLLRAALWQRAPLWAATLLPWLLLRSWYGVVGWAIWVLADAWFWHRTIKQHWATWLDAALPALEDSSALLDQANTPVAQLQRQRLLARMSNTLTPTKLRNIARIHIGFDWRWLVASAALALAAWSLDKSAPPTIKENANPILGSSELLLKVSPPAYTGIAAFDTAPRELQVPEHSEVRWCNQSPTSKPESIELSDGQNLPFIKECATWKASESLFWRWHGKRYTLRVIPDQAPTITVNTPSEIVQTLDSTAKQVNIAVTVRDDYFIKSAVLHLTLARGSGENIRFSDREVPLPHSTDVHVRQWQKQWPLTELGMEPGDELYFFIRAHDNAPPQPHISTSPTYTLRLPGAVVVDSESNAMPMLVKPESLRSQRQIIIDTEQLIADVKANPKLDKGLIRARSESIADDQGQLRRRYGQFLGEESTLFGEAHEHEGEHEGTHESKHESKDAASKMSEQFEHKHDQAENATLFDEATKTILRRILSAMWEAEKNLRAISPNTALPLEFRALESIKQLQLADRIYLHKTAFTPPPLKEEKRLSGDVLGAKSYQRALGSAPELMPPDISELMQALAEDRALPALWSKRAREWIRERIPNDEQRLAAQASVQDVEDGCTSCKPALRAWLRGSISEAPILLQATPVNQSAFSRAWQQGAKP